ncbi:MAG: DUF1697 domain-containing protein [Ignavibacterium sp.]|nr:MAG: DUF1697 domain-containing protein [Ignavibacterium sp.]
METYIAMLRGINVSGQKKIKMTDLKTHLQELNFKDVQTYIQSGNAVFNYIKSNPKKLESKIAQKILKEYSFEVSVIVKTRDELKNVLKSNPFTKDKDLNRLYVTFLSDEPAKENLKNLEGINHSPEEYILKGKIIYFYSPHGYGKAKMNNNFFENKLIVAATTRNWKTVNKLAEMANSS